MSSHPYCRCVRVSREIYISPSATPVGLTGSRSLVTVGPSSSLPRRGGRGQGTSWSRRARACLCSCARVCVCAGRPTPDEGCGGTGTGRRVTGKRFGGRCFPGPGSLWVHWVGCPGRHRGRPSTPGPTLPLHLPDPGDRREESRDEPCLTGNFETHTRHPRSPRWASEVTWVPERGRRRSGAKRKVPKGPSFHRLPRAPRNRRSSPSTRTRPPTTPTRRPT